MKSIIKYKIPTDGIWLDSYFTINIIFSKVNPLGVITCHREKLPAVFLTEGDSYDAYNGKYSAVKLSKKGKI